MSDQPEISFILVSWNVRELLISCLSSLEQYVQQPHEVIVVDNASTDGTVDRLRTTFPRVRVVANAKNLGFARGNNQGWQLARGQFVVLLNADTQLLNDPFPLLTNYLRQHLSAACVAPELLYPDHRHQQSVRRFPRLLDQVQVLLKLRSWSTPAMKSYLADPGVGQREPLPVEQVMGAAMVMPRWALQEIGLFDERFPNWFEEVDWCYRAKQAGYAVVYHPGARIMHHGGQSFGQILSLKKHVWLLTGLNRYAEKHWSRTAQWVIRVLTPISYGLTAVQTLIKPR